MAQCIPFVPWAHEARTTRDRRRTMPPALGDGADSRLETPS